MTTNYPNSIDNFVNPAGTATLASPDHAGQHTDINDAVEAIETELGTLPKGSSASVKARLDGVDTKLASVGLSARPLNTAGAYLSGSGLVLSGITNNYARTPDSAALSITGDIDIKAKVTLSNWSAPGSTGYVVSKSDGGIQRSYYLRVLSSGVLQLNWSSTGAFADLINVSSTAGASVADGGTKWIRATLDVNDGAGNRVIKFYTSDDGTSWTQLGTTITTAGTTSIFNGTAPLILGGTELNGTPMIGTVHRVILQSAYDTADNTTSLAFDADFSTQTADAFAFAESSTNAATVAIQTTRYSLGIPNTQSGSLSTASITLGNDRYQRFVVTKPIVVDMILIEVTTAPASAATVYFGLYAADNNFQPTGNVLLATDLAVASGATGMFAKQFTSVTLQVGTYLLATNPSVTMTVRTLVTGDAAISLGATFFSTVNTLSRSRTAATFGNNPNEWNTAGISTTVGSINYAMLRWSAA
jgi:hypothetical protein